MCGICGIYNYKSTGAVDRGLLEGMTRILAHRGPDGEGVYLNEKRTLGFGHRRLAIIDVEGGHQPMASQAGDVWITYNGEIYNFPELKRELENKGHKFITHSDTEVLIHLYQEYEEEMLNRLNGIFAFAIWDGKNRSLLLARDHFGVKPVYYYDNGQSFLFASELKSILLDNKVPREIDPYALDMCITFRHTPSPYTLIKNIYKLDPGCFLKINNSGISKKRYFSDTPQINRKKNSEEWVSELSDSYKSSIKRQLISDVPVGISLSGGVDSGTILSVLSDGNRGRVNAFTVGFELGDEGNEIEQAKELAGFFSARFIDKIIMQDDYISLFNKYMWHMEEPIGNESALAYYFVAELAKEKVKVLLNGQGADEPFAGYPRHLAENYSYLFRLFKPFTGFKFKNEGLSRMFYSLPEANAAERIYRIYSIIPDSIKNFIYGNDLGKVFEAQKAREYIYDWVEKRTPDGSALEKMIYMDTRTSLPDNLLLSEDKMSMACGIEARVPFLDRKVMDVAETIPASLKVKGRTQKYIHKMACEKFLPKEVVYRKKIGFFNPMDKWLAGSLGDILRDYTARKDSLSRTYFDIDAIDSLIAMHQQGKADLKRFLFLLLSIEKWYRIFILGEKICY